MRRTPGTTAAEDEAARAAAAAADARAANAQQMVRNRDVTLQGLQDQIDAMAASRPNAVLASGQGKTASLLALGGSIDLTITLSRAMPSSSYNVEVLPVSTGLLPGAATITVKSKTPTSVTLTISAIVAVAAASVVSVVVWSQS